MAKIGATEPRKIGHDIYACTSCDQAFESRAPATQCPICATASRSKTAVAKINASATELQKHVQRLGTMSKAEVAEKFVGNALRKALKKFADSKGTPNPTAEDGMTLLWMDRFAQVTNPNSKMRESSKTEVVAQATAMLQREEQQVAPTVDLTGLNEDELVQLLMPLAEQMLCNNPNMLAQCAAAQGFVLVPADKGMTNGSTQTNAVAT